MREIGGAERTWTFTELDRWAGDAEPAEDPIAVVSATGAEFIRALLAAWRGGRVVCPLEPGLPAPSSAAPLPAGCAHLKRACLETGEPAWIAFSAEQLRIDARNIVEVMGLDPAHPNLGVISPAHSFGFGNLILPLLLQGVPLYLLADGLPENLRAAFAVLRAENRQCTLPAVPALWGIWQMAGVLGEPGPPIARAISAGAPLTLSLETAVFEQAGLKIHNFYGCSECGGISYDGTETPRTEESCVGKPLPGVTVEAGVDGILRVQSPAAGLGYWPDPIPEKLDAGDFCTPDSGQTDDHGVRLTGRVDGVLNIAGRKVAPAEIENVLLTLPMLEACVIFSIPDERPGGVRTEQIITAVRRKAGEESGIPEIRKAAAALLPDWQRPRRWWVVEGYEQLDRQELRRRYRANSLNR